MVHDHSLNGQEHSNKESKVTLEVTVLPGSETESNPSYDSAYTDDDDLDAPARPRTKSYYSQRQIQTQNGLHAIPTPTLPRPGDEKGNPDISYGVKEKEEIPVRKVKIWTKPRGEGIGEKIVMTEDEDDDGYEKWKEGRRRVGKKRMSGGGGGSSATDAVVKKRRLSINKSNIPLAGKRPSSRAKQNIVVGRRSVSTFSRRQQANIGEDPLEESLSQVPEHLKKRKEILDLASKTSDERAALKLPPVYDDVDFSDDERLEELAERPSFPNLSPAGKYEDLHMSTTLGIIPAPIAQWLRDYQVKGTQFLHECFVYQRGCILGDDMGLGKTVQVIAFLTAAFGKTGDERDKKRMRKMRRLGSLDDVWYPRVLIICPGTLMDNWKGELDTWGWWEYDVYHGSKDDKESALRAAQNGHSEIMITTYTTYRNSRDVINMIPWDCVIADECHIIKESKSDITKAMNDINALCRVGLTGTALQNKYEELWTLLNWCNPGSVGIPSVWNKTISRPLKLGQAHDATKRQLGIARRIAHQLVTNLLPRMFLRRMKSLIADQLPKKSDRVVFCPLTKTQTEAYEQFCESENVQLVKYSGKRCDCGRGMTRGFCCYKESQDGRNWRELVFPCIQNLLKLCNHVANWIPLNEEPSDKRAEKLDLLQDCLPDDWERLVNRPPLENYMDPELCGKWVILQKLLSFWHANGDKVLIFSHSIRLLGILQCLFTNTSYNVEYLDGKMPLEDRVRAVSTFNTSSLSFIFLISTRAGGVGLNITSANKVVIFDPSWNPSHDLQAQDRAYRIGQLRDVEVFRLVSAGTIEELVYARQIYKQQQANIGYGASTERRYFTGVMGEGDRKGELFGLVNMLTFQGDRGPGGLLMKEVVNKTNVAEGRVGVQVVGYEAGEEVVDAEWEDEGILGVDLRKSEDEKEVGVVGKQGGKEEQEEEDGLSQFEELVERSSLPSMRKRKRQSRKHASPTVSAKSNPIQAILAAAGVQYTHKNNEVIGSSAIEAQISRRALESAHDNSAAGDISAFVGDEALQQQQQRHQDSDVAVLNNIYKFHPPLEVMKRQFCEMARRFGFDSVQEFALVVEGWTPPQRSKALEKFYRLVREKRGGIAAVVGETVGGGEGKENEKVQKCGGGEGRKEAACDGEQYREGITGGNGMCEKGEEKHKLPNLRGEENEASNGDGGSAELYEDDSEEL